MATRYLAGWNAIGQEPRDRPGEYVDIRDAVAHLVRIVEQLWDDDYYRHATSTDECDDIDGKWLPVHTALHNVGNGPTFHESTADNSLEFWIRPVQV